jgi:hypothetical protein
MSDKEAVTHNEGIVAHTVSSQATAVGKNASATVNFGSADDLRQFRASVAELKRGIENLKIPPSAKATISEHVGGLEKEAEKSSPDRSRVEGALRALSSSAKLLGEFVSNASIILGPITKIAALFGFVLP